MASILIPLRVALATSLLNLLVQGDGSIELGLSILNEAQHVVVQKNAQLLLNCSVISSRGYEIKEIFWTRNDQPITLERRMRVFENGSLLIQRVVHKRRKRSDQGTYTCFVKNNNGTVIGRRVHLEIAYIAKHFSVEPQDQGAVVGGVARVECVIDAAPQPVYVWEKDQRPLPHDESRFTVLPSGVLQISNIRSVDSGKYRCRASQGLHLLPNKVDYIDWKISREATLSVTEASHSYAPKFIHTSPNVSAVFMDNPVMECLADGSPRPTITWYFSDGEQVLMDSFVQRIGEGNLKFLEVTDEDTGSYICEAHSEGFPPIRREVRLQVKAPPHLIEVSPSYQYPIAKRIRLNCQVKGAPIPTITWYLNGEKILPNSRIKIQDESKLVISNSFMEYSGFYQCLAENDIGMTMGTARIAIVAKKDAPDPPDGLIVQVISSSAIRLEWNSVNDQICCPLLAYSVHYEEVGMFEEKQKITQTTDVTITNLNANTNYSLYVVAYNSDGASPHSVIVSATTKESVPNLAPKVRLRSDNSSSITITWDELPEENANGRIARYKIFYGKIASDIEELEVDGNVTMYILGGLLPDTEYRVRVLGGNSAGYPDLNDSLWPWVTKKTGASCPPKDVTPPLTVTALNSTAVLICWDVEDDVPITGFRLIIHKNTPEREDSRDIHIAADTFTYTLGNLGERILQAEIRLEDNFP